MIVSIIMKWVMKHMVYGKEFKMKFKEYFRESHAIETSELGDIPFMKVVPRMESDYACPHCNEIMREKDYSFRYNMDNNSYTHKCCDKPFRMPLRESYGIESSESGFNDKGEVSKVDQDKVDDIINNKELPEVAEEGKSFVVHWADGRGIFACKKKSYLNTWLKDQGKWAEIVNIKYGEPKSGDKKLKVIQEDRGVMIYRALPFSAEDMFRVSDYVTKSEKFALEHGETSSIFNGEDYKVIGAIVNSSDIKPASNPGEFLMVNDKQGRGLWQLVLDDATQTVSRKRI